MTGAVSDCEVSSCNVGGIHVGDHVDGAAKFNTGTDHVFIGPRDGSSG